METIPLQITQSNRLEILLDRLSRFLFSKERSPFDKILIIVPSRAMKKWIMQEVAMKGGIAFGFEVLLLHEALFSLAPLFSKTINKEVPRQIPLAREIEKALTQMEGFQDRNQAELALELAKLFLEAGETTSNPFQDELEESWQARLWKRVFSDDSLWIPMGAYLEQLAIKAPSRPLQVHLFGLSYLPKMKLKFFERLNQEVPLFFWNLTPSLMFLSDLTSRKEMNRLIQRLEKQGVSAAQLQDLQGYLEESNLLASNLGKLGREFAKQLEERPSVICEAFAISSEVAKLQGYQEFPLEEIYEKKLSLLHLVQGDLLLLKESGETIELEANDLSIEVVSAPSEMREVEILYQMLLKVVHEEGVHPRDILVMAPQIEKYAPFIKMVFEDPGSMLQAEVFDLKKTIQSPYIKVFFQLLELFDSRFDLFSLFEILESPHARAKMHLGLEEVFEMRSLLELSGVHFGLDSSHRKEIFQEELIEKNGVGTFEKGIEKILLSLSRHISPEKFFEIELEDPLPNSLVGFTRAEILNQFLEIFSSLKTTLSPFSKKSEMTPFKWSEKMKEVLNLFLSPLKEKEEEGLLERALFEISCLPEEMMGFPSLLGYLKTLLNDASFDDLEKNLHSVRFCALLPMRAVPASVIALLGINQETFPRVASKNRLHFLKSSEYIPSSIDSDRYLLLESLLSARQKWILSFVEEETRGPSLVVKEVLQYLDERYRVGGDLPSKALLREHPELPFSEVYFSGDPKFPNYLMRDYQSLLAQESPLQKRFTIKAPSIQEEMPEHLTLRELKALIHHPIKHYMNRFLGIYFRDPEEVHPRMVEFEGDDYLDSQYFKWSLRYPIEKVIDLAEKQGKLPVAPFKEGAKRKLRDDLEGIALKLSSQGIDPKEVFEVEFSYGVDQLLQVEEHLWRAPAIEVLLNGKKVSITGSLPYVCHQGLLMVREPKKETLMRAIPEILAHQMLPDSLTSKTLVSLSKGKKLVFNNITWITLLDYFSMAQKQLVPFLPAWVDPLLEGCPERLHQSIQGSIFDSYKKSFDPYLKWAIPDIEQLDIDHILAHWKPEAEKVFGGLREHF